VSRAAHVVKEKIEKERLAYEIIAFADNNKDLQNEKLFGKLVIAPQNITAIKFDEIIVAAQRITFVESIVGQLTTEYKIPLERINTKFVFSTVEIEARLIALKNVSQIIYGSKIKGETAELGVYQGEFAKHINKLFPDRKLYLFDTFEGFHANDIKKNLEIGNQINTANQKYDFSDTNEFIVLNKMEHPENCVVKKGYFPETAVGVKEKFAFVSLDADLHNPMYEGLQYFYPRLEKGGYIFIHDYFNDVYPGTRRAVTDYNAVEKIHYVALGDNHSIAIVK